ncbi:TadE/TadG family type IV pilus assembly protein [Tranquillimonas alkanivorans]|uniref:TadE-like protein n=1 Tax=Tranquillimonas alkanivorans TaxID=441119 RepID=A0A1I5N4F7_9RHOB|nr:TadE/TadG family type IV pilus assembly protein [Tranquillimonas alkanivorans]SFP16587.1 TadE-like protein [Tranquillimonas alkanivorans]
MPQFRDLRHHGARFLRGRDGSSTIEFLLWLPLMVFFLVLAVQVSILFLAQSSYWNVARETARLVSRHAMDATAAQAYATERATLFGTAPTVAVTTGASTVRVELSSPALALSSLDPLGLTESFTISAAIEHVLEPI